MGGSTGYAGWATAYPTNPANTGNPYIYLPLTSICAQLFSHLSAARPLSATTSGSIWTRTHRLAQVAKLNARTSVDLNASVDGKGCIDAGAEMIGDHHRMNYICYINFEITSSDKTQLARNCWSRDQIQTNPNTLLSRILSLT